MGTVAPCTHVAGGTLGASSVLCSSALGVASEESARPQPAPGSALLWGPFSVISWAHVLVLFCSPGVTHTSTNANFISQVTEAPQAGGSPGEQVDAWDPWDQGTPPTHLPSRLWLASCWGVGFQDHMAEKGQRGMALPRSRPQVLLLCSTARKPQMGTWVFCLGMDGPQRMEDMQRCRKVLLRKINLDTYNRHNTPR